jgi:hypothetical protein
MSTTAQIVYRITATAIDHNGVRVAMHPDCLGDIAGLRFGSYEAADDELDRYLDALSCGDDAYNEAEYTITSVLA